ncbi:NAD(P)H-dependent oxidoreductase [Echinicola strongylocentroti]|uniref:NAD(P)H-dependent oxidoreductase n=1 Tax=Echinicola strongylocentroti TaxID=1795355 RepID=A0A2Z4IIV9_9BACT|nr:NAD(P)H-dependent oxidoreductase [Echinicola strongylocentroti]AWW30679.1 NAD(P)H-dependent oxidoreductase [Echinicola strongylocentroti]
MSLLENLEWRYATKKMNGKAVPQEKVDYILEAARLSPSSSGLQPYRIIVITDPEMKEKIKPIAWDQSQITDASHILVFAAWENYTEDKIKEVFANTLTARGMPLDKMDAYRERLWGMYSQLPEEWHAHHAAKQAYIAFGTAIAAAAEQKVDATPMEGFDSAALDELLALKELGLKSALVLPLGYRDETNDWLAGMKKFRTPKEEFVISSAEIMEK